MAKWLGIFVACWFCSLTFAGKPYLGQHEEGWYWHNEPVETEKKDIKPAQEVNNAREKEARPDKIWKQIGKMVERARAKAILNPTVDNIAEARRLQRVVVSQANLFSERWMLDLLIHPEQDESLINPSNSAARDIYNQQNSLRKEQAIAQISQTSGLLYFYDANEPNSQQMAAVVSDFAVRYQMTIIPIAMTNQALPFFPNSRRDSGEAHQLGVKHIPAVFAVNPISKQTMPVAYGLISQSELKENIVMATNAFKSGVYHE